MVSVNPVAACDVVVFAMVVQVRKGETALSHLTTLPVFPVNVMVPVLPPLHIVVPPLTVPPTLGGVTAISSSKEVALEQAPLCTTALNWVV